MGLAVNGDVVSECAAMQLPITILNKKSFSYCYMTLFCNRYDSDLNFTLNGPGYYELQGCKFGDAFPGKIASIFEFIFQLISENGSLSPHPSIRLLKDTKKSC